MTITTLAAWRATVILALVTLGGIALTRALGTWEWFGVAATCWILAGVYGYLTGHRRGYRE